MSKWQYQKMCSNKTTSKCNRYWHVHRGLRTTMINQVTYGQTAFEIVSLERMFFHIFIPTPFVFIDVFPKKKIILLNFNRKLHVNWVQRGFGGYNDTCSLCLFWLRHEPGDQIVHYSFHPPHHIETILDDINNANEDRNWNNYGWNIQ